MEIYDMVEDLDSKYSTLSFEFSRLRSRFQNLRQYCVNVVSKGQEEREESNNLRRKIRGLQLEIDGLNFRNNQFITRIEYLQNEIRSQKVEKKKSSKNEDTSKSEQLDFFIETTKSQLSSLMQENDQLSQKIYDLQNQIETLNHEKNAEIQHLTKISENLKKKYLRQTSRSDAPNEFGRLIPNNLPSRILSNLETTIYNCLSKLYKSIKQMIEDLDSSCPTNSNTAFILLNSHYIKLAAWLDQPPAKRNRILDCANFVKVIRTSLSIKNSEYQCLLKKSGVYNIPLFLLVRNCLIEFEHIFYYLDMFSSSNSKTVVEKIEKLFMYLREMVGNLCEKIKKFHISSELESAEPNIQKKLCTVLQTRKTELANSLLCLSIIIDSELPILRLYGWFSSSFLQKNRFDANLDLIQTHYGNVFDECNKLDDHYSKNERQISSSVLQSTPESLVMLEDYKKRIQDLQQEKELLEFELKKYALLSENEISKNSDYSQVFNQMKIYLSEEIDKYYDENKLIVGHISALKTDLSAALHRIKVLTEEGQDISPKL